MATCTVRQEVQVLILVETTSTRIVVTTTETTIVEAETAIIIIARVAARQITITIVPTLGGSPIMKDNPKGAQPQGEPPAPSPTTLPTPIATILTQRVCTTINHRPTRQPTAKLSTCQSRAMNRSRQHTPTATIPKKVKETLKSLKSFIYQQ